MNAHTTIAAPVPVIATGRIFDAYLCAARQNLEHLLRLAEALGDTAFAVEAKSLLQGFEDSAEPCFAMIEDANSYEEEAA